MGKHRKGSGRTDRRADATRPRSTSSRRSSVSRASAGTGCATSTSSSTRSPRRSRRCSPRTSACAPAAPGPWSVSPDLDDVARQADEIIARARDEAAPHHGRGSRRAGPVAGPMRPAVGDQDVPPIAAFLVAGACVPAALAALVQDHAEGVKRWPSRRAPRRAAGGVPSARSPNLARQEPPSAEACPDATRRRAGDRAAERPGRAAPTASRAQRAAPRTEAPDDGAATHVARNEATFGSRTQPRPVTTRRPGDGASEGDGRSASSSGAKSRPEPRTADARAPLPRSGRVRRRPRLVTLVAGLAIERARSWWASRSSRRARRGGAAGDLTIRRARARAVRLPDAIRSARRRSSSPTRPVRRRRGSRPRRASPGRRFAVGAQASVDHRPGAHAELDPVATSRPAAFARPDGADQFARDAFGRSSSVSCSSSATRDAHRRSPRPTLRAVSGSGRRPSGASGHRGRRRW